jgi:hypothetical protein
MSRLQRVTPVNRALFLPGVSGSGGTIADNASVSMSGNTPFSLCFWVTVIAGNAAILTKGPRNGVAATSEYSLETDTGTSKARFQVSDGTTITSVTSDAFGAMALGKRHFVVGTYDGANINISVNAGAQTSAAQTTGAQDSTNALRLGIRNDGGAPLGGLINRAGIWKRALSLTEIAQLYNSGKGVSAAVDLTGSLLTSIISYWNLQNNGNDHFGGNHWAFIGNGMQFRGDNR